MLCGVQVGSTNRVAPLRFVLTAVGKPIAKEAKHGAGDVFYELKRVK